MNLLPTIANTIFNLGFQGSLADSGGHGLSPSALNAFTNAAGGTEQYGTLDSCLQGFKFDGGTKLILPNSSLLRRTDAWTIQWLMYQPTTTGGGQTWFSLVDPAGRSGGAAPDRIGSIYTFHWNNLTPGPQPYWSDVTHGSNLPVAGGAWWTTSDTAWGGSVHAISVRYAPAADGVAIDMFVDGAQQTPSASPMSTTETTTGVERFYVGGCEGGGYTPVSNSLIAGMRMVSYARTNDQILADAIFMKSPACSLTPEYPVSDTSSATPYSLANASVALAADVGRIYRYRPGHMPQLKGNR